MTSCCDIMLTMMPKMWLYIATNMTTFNHKITSNISYALPYQPKIWHILHQQKIWLLRVIFHINKKFDLQESLFTSIENMNYKGHIPHQQKIWCIIVIFYISKEYDSQESYSTLAKNVIAQSHMPRQPKYDSILSYSTSAKNMTT